MLVFLGEGNGRFQTPTTYPTRVVTSGILAADFSQDGIPDIAMSQGSGFDGDVKIFLGNGDGAFQTPIARTYPITLILDDFGAEGVAAT